MRGTGRGVSAVSSRSHKINFFSKVWCEGTRARARGWPVAGVARRGAGSFVGAHLPVLVVLPVLLRRPGAGQLGMLLVALRRQRAAGERHRDSARGRVRLFRMRAGPRPSRARRARGAAPLGRVPAARDLLEVELLSAARRLLTSRRTAAQPPGGGRFLPAQRKSPLAASRASPQPLVVRVPPRLALSPPRRARSLARWKLYVAALTVVSARGGFVLPRARHAPREAGRGNSHASDGRERRCQSGQVSSDGNGGEFSQPQNLTGSLCAGLLRGSRPCGRVRDFFPNITAISRRNQARRSAMCKRDPARSLFSPRPKA